MGRKKKEIRLKEPVRIREKKIAGGNEGLVDWDKVKKSRMTLTKWMDDFVKYNAELSESSVKTKRNTHARIFLPK
ncbi:MAG: hypothetical protein MR850_04805 [Bacteroidales bacterium]|nr:hypothetical protein [Bacteroidales bacterium]